MSAELHGQLLAAETDMNNKNKEIQTLHSSLTEAMVTKERLEQRVVEVMEMSHSMPNDSLEARVQVSQLKNTFKTKTCRVSFRKRLENHTLVICIKRLLCFTGTYE